jgi:hypothetical protein
VFGHGEQAFPVQDINRSSLIRSKDLLNNASLALGRQTIMSPAMAALGITSWMLFTAAMHRSDESPGCIDFSMSSSSARGGT